MRSLFKITLLATTMVAVLDVPLTFTVDTMTKVASAAESKSAFKNDDQEPAYAPGASPGRYVKNSLKKQGRLGIKLGKARLITDVQDVSADKSKLSDQEIEQILQTFKTHVKTAAQQKMEKDAVENEAKGKIFRDSSTKEKDVKTSKTGLLYKVEKEGIGDAPKNSDTTVVSYKGTLVDGKEFDNSCTRGKPFSFRLDDVIPGQTGGLENIKEGGRIRLVIPPNLAYNKTDVPGIPANSTLVLDVELLDIKPAPKTDAQPEVADEMKAADTNTGIKK